MDLKLESSHIKELYKNNYTVDILVLLQLFKDGEDLEEICLDGKLKAVYATIIRKGLISGGKITLEGENLLSLLSKESEVKLVKKKLKDDVFEEWWKTYPGTDSFTYKNVVFTGTRALRVKKDDCKAKIKNILNEGYTMDELIAALELEISQKKENSYKTHQNKMSYQQNSLTYLNQRTWEPFVELYRAGHKKEEVKSNEFYG